jgi:phage/plasmid-like protein (TIGR03299 family)
MPNIRSAEYNRTAYAHDTDKPWVGVGTAVDPKASAEEILAAARLNYTVRKGDVLFRDHNNVVHAAPKELNRSVLYRDDTFAPISVMSHTRYNIHQPSDVVGFMKSVSDTMGWPIDVVGSFKGGKKIWANLRLPDSFELPGGDKVDGCLLGATSYDGSLGTPVIFMSKRTCCGNQLQMLAGSGARKHKGIVLRHTGKFNAEVIREALGVAPTMWSGFIETAKRLAAIRVTRTDAIQVLRKVFPEKLVINGVARKLSDQEFLLESEPAAGCLRLFEGEGIGMNFASARDTGWGLVNAVTERMDHFGKNRDAKLNSAWFGAGALKKDAVVDAVLAL